MAIKLGKHRLLIWAAAACLSFTLSGCDMQAGTETIHLVLLHANDTHGHLFPHDYAGEFQIGGAARMAALIKNIRRDYPGRSLLLHAGDIFSRGGPITVYYGGKVDLLAMQAMDFDAMVPGNGEFYTGVDHLVEMSNTVKFPVLMANVFYKKNHLRLFSPYVIQDVAGVKIAILGLGFFYANHPAAWDLVQESPIETAQDILAEVRDKVDLVIALSHLGIEADQELAAQVSGIDIIVGGHSHAYFDPPRHLVGPQGQDVIFLQAGVFGTRLGRLDLYLERSEGGEYVLQSSQGHLIPINAEIVPDPEVAAILQSYAVPLQEVLCLSEISLDLPPRGPSPMGDFLSQVLFLSMPADVALLYRDAVHSGILPGPVTLADVCRIHQWRSRILRISLTGQELIDLLNTQKVFSSGCTLQEKNGIVTGLLIGADAVDFEQQYAVILDEALVMNTESLQGIAYQETGERVDTLLIKFLKKIKVLKEGSGFYLFSEKTLPPTTISSKR